MRKINLRQADCGESRRRHDDTAPGAEEVKAIARRSNGRVASPDELSRLADRPSFQEPDRAPRKKRSGEGVEV